MDTPIDFSDWGLPAATDGFSSDESPTVEGCLVEAAVAGDEDAFRRLVEWHQVKVFRFCCQWLKDSEDAQEVTQDTFVRAYQALGRYRKKGRFSTWLFQIALNLCRDRYKSRSGRDRRETMSMAESGGDENWVCKGPTPHEAAESSQEIEKLRQGIDLLPEKLRAVVIICGVESMSQEVCAEILNISTRAVEGRFYRARKLLAEWLENS